VRLPTRRRRAAQTLPRVEKLPSPPVSQREGCVCVPLFCVHRGVSLKGWRTAHGHARRPAPCIQSVVPPCIVVVLCRPWMSHNVFPGIFGGPVRHARHHRTGTVYFHQVRPGVDSAAKVTRWHVVRSTLRAAAWACVQGPQTDTRMPAHAHALSISTCTRAHSEHSRW
jgi:hypothetical protein